MIFIVAAISLLILFLKPRNLTIDALNSDGKVLSDVIPSYSTDQSPRFLVDSQGLVSTTERITVENKLTAKNGSIEALVLDNKGNDTGLKPVIESSSTDKSKFFVSVPSSDTFVPSLLTLKITTIHRNNRQELSKQFRWGNIIINYNQSSFSRGEQTVLKIITIGDEGQTICGAPATVVITAPTKKTTTYSTGDVCKNTGTTYQPVYNVIFIPETEGLHHVAISVETLDGKRERDSSFLVTDRVAIKVIHDDTTTELIPAATKSIKFTIRTSRPIDTAIRLPIPKAFKVESISNNGKIDTTFSGMISIVWSTELKAGDMTTLSFSYRTPDVSPALYFAGFLELKKQGSLNTNFESDIIFQDKHRWEIIATDRTQFQN